MPGTIVTGQLGGSIYEVVYRIDVPAARVILLSLTGDPGTDFDLYLFDQTATSVYSTDGQVAASTGNTSTEHIAYPSGAGGRFYIDLSGFSETAGAYRLTVQIASDTTPPRASLALDGGAPATNSATIVATLVATDDLSGVDAMQFSRDGVTWEEWQPYTPTVSWSFNLADGRKALWARVRDRQGNVSLPASATILLDTSQPTVLDRSPHPGGTALGLQPSIRVQFSEAIRPQSWTNAGLILQDPDGTVVFGNYSWDSTTNTGSFTPLLPLRAGDTYSASLGSVVDLGGNPVAPVGAWTFRPLIVPNLTLVAQPTIASGPISVELTGSIDQRLGSLLLERAIGPGPWQVTDGITPDADGRFQVRADVEANTRFRVRYSGNDVVTEGVSAEARVLVRRRVDVLGRSSATTQLSPVGRTLAIRATLTPPDPNVVVTMSIYRYDADRRGYRLNSTVRKSSSGGWVAFSWRPVSAGRYYVRLSTAPTSMYANGVSAAYRWTITP